MAKNKSDFPFFLSERNRGLIYFDNSATSHKPSTVLASITDFYTNHNANVHRGLYDLGETATILYENSREKVAKFINACDVSEVIFTKGTTEGINFIASTWALSHIRVGDEILVTQAEHHANLLPWQYVAYVTGARLVFVKLDKETFCFNEPEKYITSKTKLVAVTCASNVIGPVWDERRGQLENFIQVVHTRGARVLLDAAQLPLHKKINVQKMDADFMVFSGHKMLGPTGVGVLFIKKELHDDVIPYQRGGSMVHSVSFESARWAEAPHKFEAGTPPIAGAIGLGCAIDYMVNHVNYDEILRHEAALCSHLIDGLRLIPEVTIMGNCDRLSQCGHMVSFSVAGIHAHDIAAYLSKNKIAVRAGHHCAQPLVNLLGVDSLVRVSFALYNGDAEVFPFLRVLKDAITFLKKA